MNEEIIIEKPVAQEKINSFSLGAMRAINKIDAEHLVSNTPRFLAWFLASSTTAYFIWQQSISLYQSAGFNNYAITATGGLLLVIGSSAYFSITRSFLALLLCLYASGYEGYLMISGTINNETQAQAQSVINNPELIFLKEKADKEMAEYKRQEARYNNPATDVFENGWFKKNYVTPAWEASAKAHSDYTAKKASLIARASDSHVTWLKIFYRLGLVFLCMLFVHRFFAILTPARKK